VPATHTPLLLQTSEPLHLFASAQEVPACFFPSDGQLADAPSHASATSQTPVAARH
jgi:hypothetical protein